MTNEQILQKAIEKAMENGWDVWKLKTEEEFDWEIDRTVPISTRVWTPFMQIYWKDFEQGNCYGANNLEIIFSHDFAKAFWKPRDYAEEFNQKENGTDWQYHLQQMVVEEEPLKYLEQFL